MESSQVFSVAFGWSEAFSWVLNSFLRFCGIFWLSGVLWGTLKCSHLFWVCLNRSWTFCRIVEPGVFWQVLIDFKQFWQVADGSEGFYDVSGVLWCVLMRFREFWAVVKFWRLWSILWSFGCLEVTLIRSERFWKFPEDSEAFSYVVGVSWGFLIDYKRFRNATEGFDAFSDILRCFEAFWIVLSFSERFWNVSNGFEVFYNILWDFETFQDVIMGFERFWKVL